VRAPHHHHHQDFSDLKRQVQQMQEEAEKLEEIQKEVEAQMGTTPSPTNAQSVDARSVYIGNVPEALLPLLLLIIKLTHWAVAALVGRRWTMP
jgi:hypothetical protein